MSTEQTWAHTWALCVQLAAHVPTYQLGPAHQTHLAYGRKRLLQRLRRTAASAAVYHREPIRSQPVSLPPLQSCCKINARAPSAALVMHAF